MDKKHFFNGKFFDITSDIFYHLTILLVMDDFILKRIIDNHVPLIDRIKLLNHYLFLIILLLATISLFLTFFRNFQIVFTKVKTNDEKGLEGIGLSIKKYKNKN